MVCEIHFSLSTLSSSLATSSVFEFICSNQIFNLSAKSSSFTSFRHFHVSRSSIYLYFTEKYLQHSADWWMRLPHKRKKLLTIFCWLAPGYFSSQVHTYFSDTCQFSFPMSHRCNRLRLYTTICVLNLLSLWSVWRLC